MLFVKVRNIRPCVILIRLLKKAGYRGKNQFDGGYDTRTALRGQCVVTSNVSIGCKSISYHPYELHLLFWQQLLLSKGLVEKKPRFMSSCGLRYKSYDDDEIFN